MLKSLVEEMNRYDENPVQAMKYLNAKPDQGNNGYEYDITLTIAGKV